MLNCSTWYLSHIWDIMKRLYQLSFCWMDKIICVGMDEAHIIKEWSGSFHSDYLKLGPLHYLWLWVIPIMLGSVTVSPQMVPDLSKNTHIHIVVTFLGTNSCKMVVTLILRAYASVQHKCSCHSWTSPNCHRDFCQLQWQNKKKLRLEVTWL